MQALSVRAFQGLAVPVQDMRMFPLAFDNTEVMVLKGLASIIAPRRAPTHVRIACAPGPVKRAMRVALGVRFSSRLAPPGR